MMPVLTPFEVRLLSRADVWAQPGAKDIWKDARARYPLYREHRRGSKEAAEIVRHYLLRMALNTARLARPTKCPTDEEVEALADTLKAKLPELVAVAFAAFKAELPRLVPGLSAAEWDKLKRDEDQRRARAKTAGKDK